MASGIYKITDKRNNKIYIGRTVDFNHRKWKHFCFIHPQDYSNTSLNSEMNMKIHQAMMESGKAEDFVFEILEECDLEYLDEKEQYYIQLYHSQYPEGYNVTKGGNTYPHSQGEEHYKHKITQEQSLIIKQLLSEGKTVKEIQIAVPEATMGIISSINNGRSWIDKNLNYPLSRLNGVIKFSDEDVVNIREQRAMGKTTSQLAQKYNTTTSTISSIVLGDTHKNLPIFEERKQKIVLTEEEVLFFRQEYYLNNKTIKEIHSQSKYKELLTYDAFKNMINGTSYSYYKTYKKELTGNNRDKNKIENRNKRIKELVEQGLTKKQIAKEIGCSERTIYRVLER